MAVLTFGEVTKDTWPDFETLFESKGGPKYCWCMAFRPLAGKRQQIGPDKRKIAMRGNIEAGAPVGLLGYLEDTPIAWCSIAPRQTHCGIAGEDYDDVSPDQVWSLTCFFVRRQHRGHGIVRQLIAAAVEHARSRGAKLVEAYPVTPDSPSYRFMGFVPVFEEAGFVFVRMAGKRRHIMRLDID